MSKLIKFYNTAVFKLFFVLVSVLSVKANADFLENQKLLYSSSMDSSQYRLALGAQQKINSRWQAEREELLQGEVQKRTFELDTQFQDMDEAWDEIAQYFRVSEARTLYACEGLECGSSNTWANNHFGVKQLYGLDQQQRYLALRLNDSEFSFRTIYLVQRGNRRMYLQVDEIASSGAVPNLAPSANVILDDLEHKGFFAFELPPSYFLTTENKTLGIDEEFLLTIIEALQKKPFLKIYVVGHSTRGHALTDRSESGKTVADAFKALLVSKGIRENRLQIYSAADVMPRAGFGKDRIELVLQLKR